jgi:hypothetical protein
MYDTAHTRQTSLPIIRGFAGLLTFYGGLNNRCCSAASGDFGLMKGGTYYRLGRRPEVSKTLTIK